MDDMYKSIKAFLYDRTSSPLFGAFLLSWLLVNFKVVLTVFSSEDLQSKFHTIDILFSNIPFFEQQILWLGIIIHSLLIPAMVTLSYIYLYPLLAKPVYEHSLKKQKELREIKQKEEGLRRLSHEESREIYRKMAEVENKYNQQEEKHRKQIEALLSEIEELKRHAEKDPVLLKRVTELENKTTKVHAFDRAKLKKYDIKRKVDRLPTGNFSFEQLMGKEDWAKLDDGEKRTLGKVFNQSVKAGEYLGVSYEGEDANNHARYKKAAIRNINRQKETEKLSELKERILKAFVKYNESYLEEDALQVAGVHTIEWELALEELSHSKYLTYDNISGTYSLLTKGKKYLSDNKML